MCKNKSSYFVCHSDAFDMKYGVGILRLHEGFGLDLDLETNVLNDYTEDGELFPFVYLVNGCLGPKTDKTVSVLN